LENPEALTNRARVPRFALNCRRSIRPPAPTLGNEHGFLDFFFAYIRPREANRRSHRRRKPRLVRPLFSSPSLHGSRETPPSASLYRSRSDSESIQSSTSPQRSPIAQYQPRPSQE